MVFAPIVGASFVVVVCQRASKFLFSFSADVADVTFKLIIRHDDDSYVVPQVFRARFLFGLCFEFLNRQFDFSTFFSRVEALYLL